MEFLLIAGLLMLVQLVVLSITTSIHHHQHATQSK